MTPYRITCHVGNGTIATQCAELQTAMFFARRFRDAHSATVLVTRGARCVAVCTPREVRPTVPATCARGCGASTYSAAWIALHEAECDGGSSEAAESCAVYRSEFPAD